MQNVRESVKIEKRCGRFSGDFEKIYEIIERKEEGIKENIEKRLRNQEKMG